MEIYRIHPGTKEKFVPHVSKDGFYKLADPKFGEGKKLAKNQIDIATYDEAVSLIRKGFHVRMKGIKSGQTNLIAPESILGL